MFSVCTRVTNFNQILSAGTAHTLYTVKLRYLTPPPLSRQTRLSPRERQGRIFRFVFYL